MPESYPTPAARQPSGDYPLTVTWSVAALTGGAFLSVVADDLLSGYAAFVLLTGVALTWRRGDPPVFPFVVFYQWVAITAGFWYERWTGFFPGTYGSGSIERTMGLALTGLLLLALGIRVTSQLVAAWERHRSRRAAPAAEGQRLSTVWPLFIVVMVAYAVDYVGPITPGEFGGLASVVQRLLEFRQVLLVSLWLAIFRDRRQLPLLFVSFAWAVVPRLGAYYSEFKSPLILMLIVLTATWRPWDRDWWPRSLITAIKVAPFVAVLLVLLLVWQGGLKRDTRRALDSGFVSPEPAERIAFFIEGLRSELPALAENPRPYVEALVERASYITFFSRVLEHVPRQEPHARGELLRMAITNAVMPRFLFPDKAVLPSDSYYTRRFAGVKVAEGSTSVSIGYMAEFYADWGLGGMFVSIFAFGAWIGLLFAWLRSRVSVPFLRFGVLVVAFLSVADFEQQFIKGFAALNLNVLMMLVVVHVAGPWLSRVLGVVDEPREALSPSGGVGATVP